MSDDSAIKEEKKEKKRKKKTQRDAMRKERELRRENDLFRKRDETYVIMNTSLEMVLWGVHGEKKAVVG